jgi:DNA-binding NtrC family response regulator
MDNNSKPLLQGKPPRGAGETILLIEDEPNVRKILRLLLESYGYRVMTAESGIEGLGLFRDNQDVIRVTITDMRMKGMQGTEVIKELRSINVHARIVVVSGLRNIRELISEEPGRLIFVPKPMSKEELMVAVQSMLL